jgi:uncharacterized membrane protein YeaQ/YmgE (transglycosylase-associated protein family)
MVENKTPAVQTKINHRAERGLAMGIISWIIMGLIVGVVAKAIMPGKDPGGLVITVVLGIAGAFVGGFIGSFLGFGKVSGFNLGGLVLATGGALLILVVYRKLRK